VCDIKDVATPPNPYGDPYRRQAPWYPQPGYDPAAPYGRDPVTGEPLSDKSVVAAGVLQLFFGVFGVGRLYIGSLAIGFTQLGLTIFAIVTAIFLVGIFVFFGVAVWAFVDAIMMFAGAVRDGQGRKLR
jgi:TM2 domain-containing membrane protein YozV